MMNLKSMVLLSEASANNSATVDFTGLSSAFSSYKIIFYDVIPATNNVIPFLRIGTGATPTWKSGVSDYGWTWLVSFSTNVTTNIASGGDYDDSEIQIGGTISNGANSELSGEITIFHPSHNANYHLIHWMTNEYYTSGSETDNHIGTGTVKLTDPVTAIRFLLSSGNITSGTFKLYGVV